MLFRSVINYGLGDAPVKKLVPPYSGGGFNAGLYDSELAATSERVAVDLNGRIISYLNAWNAPHWVRVGSLAEMNPSFNNTQDEIIDKRRENYSTSWLSDWIVAEQFSPAGLQTDSNFLFNGATDANHADTPRDHSSHDLGIDRKSVV